MSLIKGLGLREAYLGIVRANSVSEGGNLGGGSMGRLVREPMNL